MSLALEQRPIAAASPSATPAFHNTLHSSFATGASPSLTAAEDARVKMLYSQWLPKLCSVSGVMLFFAQLGIAGMTERRTVAEFGAAVPPFKFNDYALPSVDTVISVVLMHKAEFLRSRGSSTTADELRSLLEADGSHPSGSVQNAVEVLEQTLGVHWTPSLRDALLRGAFSSLDISATPRVSDAPTPSGPLRRWTQSIDLSSTATTEGPPLTPPVTERDAAGSLVALPLQPVDSLALSTSLDAAHDAGITLDQTSVDTRSMHQDGTPGLKIPLRVKRANALAAAIATLSPLDRCIVSHRRTLRQLRDRGSRVLGPLAAAPRRSNDGDARTSAGSGFLLTPAAEELIQSDPAPSASPSSGKCQGNERATAQKAMKYTPLLVVDSSCSLLPDTRLWRRRDMSRGVTSSATPNGTSTERRGLSSIPAAERAVSKRRRPSRCHGPQLPATDDDIVWAVYQAQRHSTSITTDLRPNRRLHSSAPRASSSISGTSVDGQCNSGDARLPEKCCREEELLLGNVVVLCDYCAPFTVDTLECVSLSDIVSEVETNAPLLPSGVFVEDIFVEDPDGRMGQFVPLNSLEDLAYAARCCVRGRRKLRVRAILSHRLGDRKGRIPMYRVSR